MLPFFWKVTVGLTLFAASAVLFLVHWAVFKDMHTLLFYIALDVVFTPLQVLLVTLIIERLLTEREKRAKMRKLNMVIGAFFSEVGTGLMGHLAAFCLDMERMTAELSVSAGWEGRRFREAARFAEGFECRLAPDAARMEDLRDFLSTRRLFILGLLQNSNLLENERFTGLLWAICHLSEELDVRDGFADLPTSDVAHLTIDMRRAFGLLIREWLAYMTHLKSAYPYVYSLELRLNPFNPEASVVVR